MAQVLAPPATETLTTASAGIVVRRAGQLADAAQARAVAAQYAGHVNGTYEGLASLRLFEEAFGTRGRLHWVLHVPSLDSYEEFMAAAHDDPIVSDLLMRAHRGAGTAAGRWEPLFVPGSVTETVMMPQAFGMYGTAQEKPDNVVAREGEGVERFLVPTAQAQTTQSPDETLHSWNCGLLMHRVGLLAYEFRAEGRAFARSLAEAWNQTLTGLATIFLFEELFGESDRIHWLIHLRSMSTYYNLMGLRARTDPAAREVFVKQWISEEKGGGGWERLFLQSSLRDIALVPWQV